jgi:hypothetical protein
MITLTEYWEQIQTNLCPQKFYSRSISDYLSNDFKVEGREKSQESSRTEHLGNQALRAEVDVSI